jgi:hypothetical protein
MLIALLTILFLGGSTEAGILDFIAQSEEAVRVAVDDDDRRKAALALFKDMKKTTNARDKMVGQAAKGLRGALASEDEIDAIWEEYFEQRAAYNLGMLDLRERLKGQMTRDEWQEVFTSD